MVSQSLEKCLSHRTDRTVKVHAEKILQRQDSRGLFSKFVFISLVVSTALSIPSSYAFGLGHNFNAKNLEHKCSSTRLQMYPPSGSPTSQTQGGFASNTFDENRAVPQVKTTGSSSSLRAAAVASSDVLPEFRAAHGLLHPHTFMKLQEHYGREGGCDNAAVEYFLNRYQKYGPMACVQCLSDPNVLPQLTEAMRAIDCA